MRRITKNAFFPMSFNLNYLHFPKIFITALVLITYCMIFAAPIAFATDHNRAASYKENLTLNDLFEKEGFKVGLSCDETAKVYSLDNATVRGQRTRLESSIIGFGEEQTPGSGFFKGACFDNKLDYVQKIVSLHNNEFDQTPVFEDFINQYGKPDFQKKGLSDIRYYMTYKGKFVEFSLKIRKMADRKVLIYELEDRSSKVK